MICLVNRSWTNNAGDMILNDLKIAFRSIKSSLFYTSINIIGLSVGITASVLISLYVLDELSYDSFHQDAHDMYRVGLRAKISGQEVAAAATCPPMAAALKAEFPEVKESIRLAQWQETPVKFNDLAFTENSIVLADSNFFDFFSYRLLAGDPKTALDKPNKVVLSQSLALKYFGDVDASMVVGKMIEVGYDRFPCMITGVIENAPSNSHIPYQLILSMDTWEMSKGTMWVNNFLYNYVKLYPDADPEFVESKLADLVDKYVGPEASEVLGMDLENVSEEEFYYGYFLMPVRDIHLHSDLVAEMKPASNIMDVYVFSVIAIFILFIAIINFVNLTTAKGGKKTKEVGIRKTAGASRSRLVAQFLMESVLQAFFAMIIAGGIIQLLIEPFNQVVQKNLSFSLMHDLWIVPGMLILALLIGILAGIYPSLYLTSFKPAEVLRGTWGGSGKSKTVRNALVILQFSISSFLIVSTVLVYKQMNLLQTFNLGFDKEQVLVIKNGNSLGGSYPLFKEKVLGISGIRTASKSTHLPPGVSNSSLFRPDDGTDDQLLYHYWVDYDHMNALDLKMKAGRFFSEDFPSDSMAIIINQAALDRFGWDDYEGHRILTFLTSTSGGEYVDVIGVVSDFNYASLKEEIQPLAIVLANDGNLISLKMTSDDYSRIIGEIEREWKELSNGAAFDYYFLDEAFDNSYQSEQRMSKIFTLFTLLAIMIACLGLFGLATFTAEQKSKEIGIRKALGATLPNIVLTLSAKFLKLVGVAEIIGLIAAYFIMSDWLNEFAYKTAFSLWIFAGSAVLVMLIAFLTITYQAVSVGSAKPSEVLNG